MHTYRQRLANKLACKPDDLELSAQCGQWFELDIDDFEREHAGLEAWWCTLAIRRWSDELQDFVDVDQDAATARLFAANATLENDDFFHRCDIASADLDAVAGLLRSVIEDGTFEPMVTHVTILDEVSVKPEWRGLGLATVTAAAGIRGSGSLQDFGLVAAIAGARVRHDDPDYDNVMAATSALCTRLGMTQLTDEPRLFIGEAQFRNFHDAVQAQLVPASR